MRIHNPAITGSFTVTGSKLNIDADGNITSLGSVTANQYIVSSSVTNTAIATASGSTAFGDTSDDTHEFTGSLSVLGTGTPLTLRNTSNGQDTTLKIENTATNASPSLDMYAAADRDSLILFREGGSVKSRIFNDASADALTIHDGADAARKKQGTESGQTGSRGRQTGGETQSAVTGIGIRRPGLIATVF